MTAAKTRKRRSQAGRNLGKSIEAHPLFQDMLDMLRQRFSGETIHALLSRQHRERLNDPVNPMPPLPSARTIYRYLENNLERIQPVVSRALETGLREEFGVHPKVDMLRSAENLYIQAEERLARALQAEADLGVKLPLAAVDQAYQTMLNVQARLIELQKEMGVLNPQANAISGAFEKVIPRKGTSKCTLTVRRAIVTMICQGNWRSTAAHAAGVHPSTLMRWLNTGEAQRAQKRETVFTEFYVAVGVAESMAQVKLMDLIQQATATTWQAAAWILERRWPELYGRRQRIDLDILGHEADEAAERWGVDRDEVETLARQYLKLEKGKQAT